MVATVRFGLIAGGADGSAAVWKRPMSPQAVSVAAAHKRAGTAQRRRLTLILLHSTHVVTVVTCPSTRLFSYFSVISRVDPRYVLLGKPVSNFPDHAFILAHHFDLFHPKQLNSRPTPLLNPAADPNTQISSSTRSRHMTPRPRRFSE